MNKRASRLTMSINNINQLGAIDSVPFVKTAANKPYWMMKTYSAVDDDSVEILFFFLISKAKF